MKNLSILLTSVLISLAFSATAFSYEQSDATRKYDRDSGVESSSETYEKRKHEPESRRNRRYDDNFKSNYSKYKRYSPEKRKRYKNKWSSFKQDSNWNGLSNDQKKKLRRKVLEKRRKRRRSYNN